MLKIKVIDLLNKIANGEELPKKIRYNVDFYDTKTSNNFSLMIYEAVEKMNDDGEVQLFLNDEVEIIEEDKKIEKIEYEISDDDGDFTINGFAFDYEQKLQIIDKINEIIDYINKELNN